MRTGLALALTIIIDLVVGALLVAAPVKTGDYSIHLAIQQGAIILLLVAIFGLFLLVVFDKTRKQGKALFDEIAVDQHGTSKEDNSLSVRITLREFAFHTDLPLIPGPIGVLFYTTVNTISVFVAVWSLVRSLNSV